MAFVDGSPQTLFEFRRENEQVMDRFVRNLREAPELARPDSKRNFYLSKQSQFRVSNFRGHLVTVGLLHQD